jgi:hypothetical protein
MIGIEAPGPIVDSAGCKVLVSHADRNVALRRLVLSHRFTPGAAIWWVSLP